MIVERDPRHQVTREPLEEEPDRQAQHVSHESRRHRQRQLRRESDQRHLLKPREARLSDGGRHQPQGERDDEAALALTEHEVDEDLQEGRDDQSRNGQREAGHDAKRERCRRGDAGKPRREGAHEPRPASSGLELGARGELEHHAGERAIELLPRDAARAIGRVVHPHTARPGALDDEEVIEVPEHDRRQRAIAQATQLRPHPRGRQAVAARRFEDVGGLGTVAGDAAGNAELLERHVAPVISEHDAERGRAAFDGFLLDDGWGAHTVRREWQRGSLAARSEHQPTT